MQLKVFLDLDEKLILPINYNHILQGIIYHSISNTDKKFTEKLHDIGTQHSYNIGHKFKHFCFSKLICKNYKIVGKNIEFSKFIFWEIRSIDAYFIHLLYTSFEKNGICFGNRIVKPRLELENKVITDENIHIRTLSPIVVSSKDEEEKQIYFSPNDREFKEHINMNLQNKYYSYYNTYPNDDVEIIVDYVTAKDKVITTFKKIYINAWNGIFYLESSPDILTFLYDTGIGSKNSSGFGMFNIIDE